MKIRRALATAAATAVIAPAALLAAAPAYAEGPEDTTSTTQGTTGETTGGDTTDPGTGTGDSTGDNTTGDTGSGDTTTGGDNTSDDGATSGDPAADDDTADDSTPGDDSAPGDDTAPEDDTAGDTPGEDDPASGDDEDGTDEGTDDDENTDEPSDEDEFPPYCEEVDENYQEQALDVELSGLPGKIVAGSGWTKFSLTVTNDSETDLKEVALWAEIENFEVDEAKWLSPYVDLEFRNPVSNQWESIGDQQFAGGYFWGVDNLKPKDFVKADLRVNIHKDAPAGDSYGFGTGAHLDTVEGQECIAESAGSFYEFEVLKPGSTPGDPGEAKPGDNEGKPGDKPGPDTKPQGGVEKLPVTGNLAATGSSSALPTIATIGGVAMAVGAGAIIVVRRRRAAGIEAA
ncbi:LAETG motif-containing sortase-dependent surface protein [Streptomyces pathocidini]|uniref:LAETG motif-containing sortase-dependent surface protein n=1 Tax=Streptomyces pathocidini TaxID=1650571 RepID=A0ABW7UVX7_9ACTN|nr:LAETG motif-containing sortase-dependent surface protein [Streptomyces pathocidini]